MLRSAEVDAVLNQTILVPQSGAKCHEKAIRGNHPVSSQPHYQCPMLLTLSVRIINSIHLKQKDGSVATRAPPVILMFF